MKKKIYILLILSIFISCSKIKDDNEKYLGQYEWIYSYWRFNDWGSNLNFSDPNNITDRFAIVIYKNYVCLFQNGSLTEKYRIKGINILDIDKCEISTKDYVFTIDNNILSCSFFPFINSDGSKSGSNIFEHTK